MELRTKQFLRKRFADYYQNSLLELPHDFKRREWGFIFFDELPEVVMRRHKAFSGENEAFEYIRGMVPAHAYHSAAYYGFPGASTMKEKLWEGADLIFDLDADHLPPDVRGKSYKEMLDAVKKETGKLLDYLIEDFGFSENDLNIVFSGGRGYHIHVRDPRVLALESPERREILDYVTVTGFDEKLALGKTRKKIRIHDGLKHHPLSYNTVYEMEEMSTIGKRIAEETVRFLDRVRTLEPDDAMIELKRIENMTAHKAKNILQSLQPFKSYDELRKTIFEAGLDQTPTMWNIQSSIIEHIRVKAVSRDTDEPVTADIRRLIRLPSSLHGGSGMRVVPLSISDFEDFEPLYDAVVFSEKMIDVKAISPVKPQNSKIEMKGKSFTITEGKNTLPEYAAIYLMCRGAAEYA